MSTASQALPALRADLRFTAHGDSKGIWYAVEDLRSGRFVRLGRKEYLVASALDGKHSLDDILVAVQKSNSPDSVTREQATAIITWIAAQGLISVAPQLTVAADDSPLANRKPVAAIDPFIIRIPLLSGRAIERISRPIGKLLTLTTALVAAAVLVIAAILVGQHLSEFLKLSCNLFVEDAKLWWLVAWLALKIVHELGHAAAASRVGCQIRSAGVHFIFMAPIPYVDVTDLWSIPNRWHRVLCSAAGMSLEFVVAAVAAIVAVSVNNESLQYFAAAVATLGTVTTIGFNANPFIRFDGYYILSDVMGRPNLWTEGQVAIIKLIKTVIFPFKSHTGRFSWPLAAYGLACISYRIIMLVTLAWWALVVWQGVGILLVAWGIYLWFVSPIIRRRKIKRPSTSGGASGWQHRLENLAGMGFSAACAVLILWLPSPIQPTVPGVVAFSEPSVLRSDASGFLDEVLAIEKEQVDQGQIVARLSNPALDVEFRHLQLQVELAKETTRVLQARGDLAKSQAEHANLNSLEEKLVQLEKRCRSLEIRATRSGQLLLAGLQNRIGQYLPEGELLGMVVDSSDLEVKGSTNQKDRPALQRSLLSEVHVHSHSGQIGSAQLNSVNTRGEDVLDEPALAAKYGGPIPVELIRTEDGTDQLKLLQPRFQVIAKLHSQPTQRWTPGEVVWVTIPSERLTLGQLFRRQIVNWWQQLPKTQNPS